MSKNLKALMNKGCSFLGCEHAILAGAMSWVSEANLVAAISNAGAFGVIACSAMPPELLSKEIDKTFALTEKNFGVNLITMHPQMDELIDVCINKGIKYVVLAGGLPKTAHIQKLKEAGVKVLCFAPALIIAKKLIKSGADAIVIEGMEAGGHIGPVSTSVLVQEILPHIKDEVPVFVAGGIGSGEMIATYLLQGAAGCQLGTMFVCASESIAHENFKNAFVKANSRDANASVQLDENFPVIPVRAIDNKGTKEFLKFQREVINQFYKGELSKEDAQLKIEHYWAGALRRAVVDGDVENGSLMAGQSVGLVKKIEPAKDIIMNLINSAEQFLGKL
ncbi:MAG: nitronate monooxygenase [Alphaproteobacteria bacterium]|nr:nitronate monooxygenase [Alphaproteobacteria bacterium]OJV12149.1 MAG: 2-nitropropane dioxygenase [Alphaproteobacteria bacterium 33-17]